MNSVRSNNISLKYQRFTTLGSKDIGIINSEFVATTQFLSTFFPSKVCQVRQAIHLPWGHVSCLKNFARSVRPFYVYWINTPRHGKYVYIDKVVQTQLKFRNLL